MACKNNCKTTSKYTLMMDKGAYFSDSLFGLFWEMTRHRFWHWRKGHGWMD